MSVETCSLPTLKKSDLDFRADFYRNHQNYLLDQGLAPNEVWDVVYGNANRELTATFLERFVREKLVHFTYTVGEGGLDSPGYEKLGGAVYRYGAAIQKRKQDGQPFVREEAELEGFLNFSKEISESKTPKAFVLISPPPPSCELVDYPGYGSYSFYFFGKYNPDVGVVDMFAWRNEKTQEMQAREANKILSKEEFTANSHPNEFLRKPIFAEGGDLSAFKNIICDMPSSTLFELAKGAQYEKYRVGIERLSAMIADLIQSGADDDTLIRAQVKCEMEFVKWVTDNKVEELHFEPALFKVENHGKFSAMVYAQLSQFVKKYKVDQFACGSCGGSAFTLSSGGSGRFSNPGPLEEEILNLILGAPSVECKCGASVELGSKECGNCGLTKSAFDAEKSRS